MLLLFASRTSGRARRLDGFIAHVLQRRNNHRSVRVRIIMQEDRPDLFERFHVTEVPTMIVIHDQQVVRRHVGGARPHDVEALLHEWLH